MKNDLIMFEMKNSLESIRRESDKFYKEFYKYYVSQVFESFKNGEDIGYRVLNEIGIGKTFKLPSFHGKKIISTRAKNAANNVMHFETEFEGEAILTNHFHSDCDEALKVVNESTFHCLVIKKGGETEEHELHNGDMLLIDRHDQHQISNISSHTGLLSVKFLK